MQKLMRKRILIPVAALAALAITAVAFAYFTSSGTGSGSATVGTDAGVTITGVSFDSTLYPGGSTNVRFTINNTSTSTAVQVGSVIADTSAGTNGITATSLAVGCDASWFTFDPVTVNTSIPAGRSVGETGTLHFAESNTNQDACQRGSPTLNLTVDNSRI